MEERHAKGLQSRPLESCFYTGVRRGDVPTLYVFALVQLTRFRPVRGVCKHTVSTDSVVLLQLRRIRWHLENNRPDLWSAVGWLRRNFYLPWHPHPKGTSYGDAEASPSGRSTQSAWKQCGARHARLNRVKCTVAKWFAQSTSEWPKTLLRGSNGGRSPLGLSFSPIFLQTKKDGATGGRWFSREVDKKRATKDGAVGDRWFSRKVGKKRTAKDGAVGDRWFSREVGKKRTAKDIVPGGRIEKRMSVNT